MDDSAPCLNCGATLVGRFCAACGQRALPPYPTVRELAGDAWNELSGYDGRIAATFRGLLKPGLLTRRYIEGQRARYLSPIRLYLIVSLVYFLVAAAAPSLDPPASGRQTIGPGIRFGVTGAGADGRLSAEDREELVRDLESAPWVVRPMLRAIADNPDQFRARLFTTMPRVFFGLLPVFAAIVALFYRGQTFPTSLMFSVHLHAFAFAVLTIGEVIKFSASQTAALVGAAAGLIVLFVYTLLSLRAVFGGGVLSTIGKMAGIGGLYALAAVPAFLIILMWAAVS